MSAGDASVGVLPLPQHGEDDPWWPGLAGRAAQRLSIVAQLVQVRRAEKPTRVEGPLAVSQQASSSGTEEGTS